ncbi:MAG: hypothetical protein ACR2KK_09855 [Acidimicrobiales bacterium]
MRTFRKLAASSLLALSLLAVGANAPVFASEGEPVSYDFTWDEPQPV